MRKPIIAGNWKMYKTRDEVIAFSSAINGKLPSQSVVDSVICAPALYLRDLVKRQGADLRIGAQNMHYAEEGAYTGEIAPKMLKSIEVEYVIIGHSERRAMFNETDESVNKKLHAAFAYGLTPILCVGELLEHREGGLTEKVIGEQIEKDLAGLTIDQVKELVIAYEPIWAIGTGKTATPEVADETCGFIRGMVEKLYGAEASEAIRIQYGGSVKIGNIKELMAKPNIDGALIGGASLDPENFVYFTKVAAGLE